VEVNSDPSSVSYILANDAETFKIIFDLMAYVDPLPDVAQAAYELLVSFCSYPSLLFCILITSFSSFGRPFFL
jgi:hypothetical protein